MDYRFACFLKLGHEAVKRIAALCYAQTQFNFSTFTRFELFLPKLFSV